MFAYLRIFINSFTSSIQHYYISQCCSGMFWCMLCFIFILVFIFLLFCSMSYVMCHTFSVHVIILLQWMLLNSWCIGFAWWAVTFGTARRLCRPHLYCTKCKGTSIEACKCTLFMLLYNASLLSGRYSWTHICLRGSLLGAGLTAILLMTMILTGW